jgi:hypothetical protein
MVQGKVLSFKAHTNEETGETTEFVMVQIDGMTVEKGPLRGLPLAVRVRIREDAPVMDVGDTIECHVEAFERPATADKAADTVTFIVIDKNLSSK